MLKKNVLPMTQKAKILVIYTGGTIGMRTDPATGALKAFDFTDVYNEFPALRSLPVELQFYDGLTPIDSSNVTPELWVRLAEIVRDHYDRVDGFVVLHGTDTMSYTASALSFMLENLAKPVIFTGSQIPMGVLRTDGRENLITAIEIASAKDADGGPLIPEVAIYFQSNLFRANRTTKRSAEQLNAFTSNNYPPLAEVGVTINYQTALVRKCCAVEPLRISCSLSRDIVVIRLFPGITERTLRAMLGVEGVRGVVLETYGAGNAPTAEWFVNALREVIDRGVCVVNVTQCHGGAVAAIYETGVSLLNAGVVSGGDMTTEAAVTKLMYVLGNTFDPAEVRRQMLASLRGERS